VKSPPRRPPPTPIVECIVVTYGRLGLLRRTMETFIATRDSRAHLTVVDNGSLADVRSFLARAVEPPNSLILLGDNLGKPHAWNLAAHAVTHRPLKRAEPKYLLFLDSDVEFKDSWLDTLVETWEDHAKSGLGCLSGFTSHKELETVVVGGRRSYKPLRFPAGCCMFTTPEIWRDVGPFDQGRLIRAVDTDYYRRLRKKGYIVGCVHPDSCIVHTGRKQRSWSILNSTPRYLP